MAADLAFEFGRRLRELREAAGLTQAQLAERARLHPQGIVKLERGEREPAWSTLLALADALGVRLDDFAEKPTTPATKPSRGRPPKAKASEGNGEPASAPKKSRGRLRKEK